MFCRYCGLQLKPNKLKQHEKNCSKSSKNDDKSEFDSPENSKKAKKEANESPPLAKESSSSQAMKEEMENKPFPNKPENPPSKSPESNSWPIDALKRNEPKQAWNAKIPIKTSGRLTTPFPGVKKYRHYPVSCTVCNRKFQPDVLKKHMKSQHPEIFAPSPSPVKERGRSSPEPKKRKTGGGPPRQLKICYICGRQFGSLSLPIHEPKCLEKWRHTNESLPKNKRMKEPVKPQVIDTAQNNKEALLGSKGYSKKLPDYNRDNEAAYRAHLSNLVPCKFCRRTFNPDRVMVHENACFFRQKTKKKRPKTR